MADAPIPESTASQTLQATRVYLMAGLCLVVGLAIGYLLGGAQPAVAPPRPVASAVPASGPAAGMSAGHMPTMDEMKRMADKQAAPLLEKLKSDPSNSALLGQIGAAYHTSHQFKEAAAYYNKAVQADPKNIPMRTKLASSLYRSGDADGAIAQLNEALNRDPKDANSLFDLGMIRWQGKQDGKGALAAWRQLLKSNPELSADRRALVQKLMTSVQATAGQQP